MALVSASCPSSVGSRPTESNVVARSTTAVIANNDWLNQAAARVLIPPLPGS